MSISVKDAMQLNQLKSLDLVSGQNGLDKKIEKIGILDHELIEGIIDNFAVGDFVLTTFTPIRNDIEKIKQCIKDLVQCNVSALAIKTIYIKSLPDSIISYADKNNLPILMFDEKIFFEDIIEDLIEGMRSRNHMELMASKIDILFHNDLKKPVIKTLANELNSNFHTEHTAIYLKEKNYTNDTSLISLAERYQRNRSRSIHHSMFKYKEGLLLILSYKKISEVDITIDLKHVLNIINTSADTFFIGESGYAQDLAMLDQSIKECIYAAQACEILEINRTKYCDIGIYKLLLPHADSKWLNSFAKGIIEPIRAYDDGKLLDTARQYIACNGDIKATSELMFQHKNTIRYRVNKMASLLNATSEHEFYEQLSIAIKCEKLIEKKS